MHTWAFSSFSPFFFFFLCLCPCSMHLDILSWLCQPCCLTPQGHGSLKSHLTFPERLGTAGEDASGGEPSNWQHIVSLLFPWYSWGAGRVFEGCWFSFPSLLVLKLCHSSIFQMIHWEREKKGIKKTNFSFSSRMEGFSTKGSGHFWSSNMHSKKAE